MADDRPQPKFEISQTITVPADIHPGGTARIVGREFGESYSRKHHEGWVYYITFDDQGPAWEAAESELIKWQQAGKQ